MVSNAVKEVSEQDRRKLLAGFLYDMAKLMFGSVAVGGLSPLIIGGDFGLLNIVCFFLLVQYVGSYLHLVPMIC